jgi:hypothetical protein
LAKFDGNVFALSADLSARSANTDWKTRQNMKRPDFPGAGSAFVGSPDAYEHPGTVVLLMFQGTLTGASLVNPQNIISRNLRGPKIKEAIASALAAK